MGLASLLTGALEPHSRLENWPFLWKSEPTSVRLLGKGEEKIFAVQTEQALVGEVARFRSTQAGAEGALLARCPVSGDVEICFLANALLSCFVLTRCPASRGCGWPHTGVCPPEAGWGRCGGSGPSNGCRLRGPGASHLYFHFSLMCIQWNFISSCFHTH